MSSRHSPFGTRADMHFLGGLLTAADPMARAQILTVYHPGYFLLMASIANTLKGVSMMAGGSTRAAFNISFAQARLVSRCNTVSPVFARVLQKLFMRCKIHCA